MSLNSLWILHLLFYNQRILVMFDSIWVFVPNHLHIQKGVKE